jgi:hypothetical protein
LWALLARWFAWTPKTERESGNPHCQLLASIPRLEPVQEILASLHRRYSTKAEGPLPYGARLLKIVLDYDILETRGCTPSAALDALRSRRGWYDPEVLEAWCRYRSPGRAMDDILALGVSDLQPGMVFVDDVRAQSGLMLLARGTEASEALLARIRNYGGGVVEPLRMRMPTA